MDAELDLEVLEIVELDTIETTSIDPICSNGN